MMFRAVKAYSENANLTKADMMSTSTQSRYVNLESSTCPLQQSNYLSLVSSLYLPRDHLAYNFLGENNHHFLKVHLHLKNKIITS